MLDSGQQAVRARRHQRALVAAVLLAAINAIVFELLLGTLSSFLLGDSILEFSLTIGIFLSAMGLGSHISRYVVGDVLRQLIRVELAMAVLGGSSVALLTGVYVLAEAAFRPAHVLWLVILGVGAGLELPLFARLMRRYGELHDTLATALSFDYLGSLAASLLFPLVLFPYLGLMRTAFASALLSVAAAAILNVGLQGPRGRRFWLLLGLISAYLTAGALWGLRLSTMFEQEMYGGVVLTEGASPYQRFALVQTKVDLQLRINGNLQFSSFDERRYHEALVHPAMTSVERPVRVLILGGGDGLAAREVLRYGAVQRLLLVDIDPAMTDLAQTHRLMVDLNEGALADPRVDIRNEDAFEFVERPGETFDVVIADFPDPSTIALARLYSLPFYRLVRAHLAPGGVLAVQSTSPTFTPRAFWSIGATLRAAGYHVRPYHNYVPSFGEWGYHLAALSSPPRPWADLPQGLTTLDAAALAGLFHFPPDRTPPPGIVPNGLASLPLLRAYLDDIGRFE